MNHVVFFSGGKASFVAAKRVCERVEQNDRVWLLFADTQIEDPDLHRFLREGSNFLGKPLVKVYDDGRRNPWDVFNEKRFINHRANACSVELKVLPCRRWLETCEFSPQTTILYLGIGWEEVERTKAIEKNWLPYRVEFPLLFQPWLG